MGDSRKYPYHTTGGILEFRGRGGVLGLEFRRRGGVTQFGIPKAWGGCFSSEFSEFPEERQRKLGSLTVSGNRVIFLPTLKNK